MGSVLISTFVVGAAVLCWLVINGIHVYIYSRNLSVADKVIQTFSSYDTKGCLTFRDEIMSSASCVTSTIVIVRFKLFGPHRSRDWHQLRQE